jgi:hypothetical protein
VTEPRPATIRVYFDADVLGVAKVVAALRYDVTYPGDPGATINKRSRPACPVTTPAAKDDVWIPEVAQHGWLIITRDRHIQDHPAEIAAVAASVGQAPPNTPGRSSSRSHSRSRSAAPGGAADRASIASRLTPSTEPMSQ